MTYLAIVFGPIFVLDIIIVVALNTRNTTQEDKQS